MNLKHTVGAAAAALMIVGGSAAFAATLKSTATLSVTLTPDSPTSSTQTGIAYDPTLDLYYGAGAGSVGQNGFVWDGAGVLQSTDVTGIDVRGIWYNANTGTVETNTYNPASASPDRGLMTVNRGSSNEWGGSGTKIRALAGTAGSQSVMDYDAGRNVLYSREVNGNVNVIDYDTGTLASSIVLAGMSAGPQYYTIGYIASLDALVTYNQITSQAQVFDMSGALLGAVAVGGVSNSNFYGMAYENGLLFVYDSTVKSWKGFDITDGDDDAMSPVPLPAGLPLLIAGLGAFGLLRRKQAS